MVEELMKIATTGVDWVLWILFVLGAISAGICMDRMIVLWKSRGNNLKIRKKLVGFLSEDNIEEAEQYFKKGKSVQERIVVELIEGRGMVPEALSEMMESRLTDYRQKLRHGIGFLGTVGSNAPFIGLFGTVLGVIKAFHDLSLATYSGPSVVMKGISQALVATAVGLLIAIPALWMHNYLTGIVADLVKGAKALGQLVLAFHIDRSYRDLCSGASVFPRKDEVKGASVKFHRTLA